MEKEKKVAFTVRMPASLYDRFYKLSKRRCISMGAYLRAVLSMRVEAEEANARQRGND